MFPICQRKQIMSLFVKKTRTRDFTSTSLWQTVQCSELYHKWILANKWSKRDAQMAMCSEDILKASEFLLQKKKCMHFFLLQVESMKATGIHAKSADHGLCLPLHNGSTGVCTKRRRIQDQKGKEAYFAYLCYLLADGPQ